VKYLKKIRQLDPTYVAAIKLMGEIFMKEKKFDRAVQFLKEALSLNEKDSEVLVMLGNILHEHGSSS
jgi:Tfp pilus assembly protein PilF